jgi:hypothetical protein
MHGNSHEGVMLSGVRSFNVIGVDYGKEMGCGGGLVVCLLVREILYCVGLSLDCLCTY